MSKPTTPCGCCEGPDILTPVDTAQRPGLASLRYRAGDYNAFLETMLARLGSASAYPALSSLTTREPSDPAIALLDAWAIVADVLTFYNERIANEGFLRTATERRSILELGRLVGYALRPGVAASTFVAFTLEDGFAGETPIGAGTRVQSVPGGAPGELPQTFETAALLKARAQWNNLQVRVKRPETEWSIRCGHDPLPSVYLAGISTNLKANDVVEIRFPARSGGEDLPGTNPSGIYRVVSATPDAQAGWTLVALDEWLAPPGACDGPVRVLAAKKGNPFEDLVVPASLHPASPQRLRRDAKSILGANSDVAPKALAALVPAAAATVNAAVANVDAAASEGVRVWAYRGKASLFGHNHPGRISYDRDGDVIKGVIYNRMSAPEMWAEVGADPALRSTLILDGEHGGLRPGHSLLVHTPTLGDIQNGGIKGELRRAVIDRVQLESRRLEGVTSKVTVIEVRGFLPGDDDGEEYVQALLHDDNENWERYLQKSSVYILAEALPPAEEPLTAPVCGGAEADIELDRLYAALQPGQWVVITGERTDVTDQAGRPIPGIVASEVAMVAAVSQRVAQVRGFKAGETVSRNLPGDKVHTFIRLSTDLAYCYKRDTVKIYGNVVKATHGETQREVLGHGDAAQTLQTFTLKQRPLTFVSASSPAGAASTLKLYINDVEWLEAPSLTGLGPADRRFTTKTGDDGVTSLTLGTGVYGARVPTGVENVKAIYRKGIGSAANLAAGRITTALDRPQGVREVVNPVAASGGADPEDRDSARANIPVALAALDRLVSVRDYADFARTFAGIGKAVAARLSDGYREVIHVTIAGAGDIPIETSSDVYLNLRRALTEYGDPSVPVRLAVRELKLPFLSAGVRLEPGYLWEPVEAALRAALLDHFGFLRRDLGQDILLGEIIGRMQATPGVAFVDVDLAYLFSVEEIAAATAGLSPEAGNKTLADILFPPGDGNGAGVPKRRERLPVSAARPSATPGVIQPAQLAYFSPAVPETLILHLLEEQP